MGGDLLLSSLLDFKTFFQEFQFELEDNKKIDEKKIKEI